MWGGCGAWCPASPFNVTKSAMFGRKKFISEEIEKLTEDNITRFISSYPNYDFTGYFPDFPKYFMDCCGVPFCPDGCEDNSPGCPKKEKEPTGNLKAQMAYNSTIRGCPNRRVRVHLRAPIGDLTDQEKECIRQKAGTYIIFHRVDDISPDSPDHAMLLKNFETYKTANRQDMSREDRIRINVALALIKLAAHLRATRRRAWGYSLVVGNVPGIPIKLKQSERDAFRSATDPQTAETTKNETQAKERKPRRSKYEEGVQNYLHNLVVSVKEGDLSQDFALKLTPLVVAGALKEKPEFKTVKIKGEVREVKIESIEDRVGRTKTWKNRNDILKQIGSSPPLSVSDVYDNRTFNKSTGLPDSVSKVRSNEEYETAVEKFLHALYYKAAETNKIKPDEYCSMVSELTTKVVATWIQKNEPAFRNRSIATISDGVRDSTAWNNREEILNTDRYRETAEE